MCGFRRRLSFDTLIHSRAGAGTGEDFVVFVMGVEFAGQGEGEGDAGATEGHNAVVDDEPPSFGEGVDVPFLFWVEGVEF